MFNEKLFAIPNLRTKEKKAYKKDKNPQSLKKTRRLFHLLKRYFRIIFKDSTNYSLSMVGQQQ